MMTRTLCRYLAAFVIAAAPAGAAAGQVDATADSTAATADRGVSPETTELSYLVPELKGAGYHVSSGRRQFKHRFSFNPGLGQLGSRQLFAFRLAYNPNSWLGYEISLGHNPASSLHALLHTFNVILRYPLPWRAQPYATFGYGMMTVFPGAAINADPVTKNTITAGGGLEFFIRDDIALRGEIRSATVYGQEQGLDDTVAYVYREYTIGFAFYRNLEDNR